MNQRSKQMAFHDFQAGTSRDDDDDAPPTTPSSQADSEESASNDEPENRGTLILDAMCVPADIHYPTDVRLQHEAREKKLVNETPSKVSLEKPRHAMV